MKIKTDVYTDLDRGNYGFVDFITKDEFGDYGVDVYDLASGEYITFIPDIGSDEIEEMTDSEFNEFVDENI